MADVGGPAAPETLSDEQAKDADASVAPTSGEAAAEPAVTAETQPEEAQADELVAPPDSGLPVEADAPEGGREVDVSPQAGDAADGTLVAEASPPAEGAIATVGDAPADDAAPAGVNSDEAVADLPAGDAATANSAAGVAEAGGEAAPEDAAIEDPALLVQRVEVPDTNIDVDTAGGRGENSDKAKATAARLQAAVEGVIAEFGGGIADLPEGELRSALTDWTERLQGHVQELHGIVEKKVSSPAAVESEATASSVAFANNNAQGLPTLQEEGMEDLGQDDREPMEPMDAAELVTDLESMRNMRQQLECHRTGRGIDELTSAWADPEETAREVAELQRVRRQIRYIFGGMVSNLPDSSTFRMEDLFSDNAEVDNTLVSRGLPLSTAAFEEETVQLSQSPALPSKKSPAPGGLPPRPRSGGTESSLTASSVVSWDSQATHGEDRERHREKKERKHRKHHRHREESADAARSRDKKKDDGSIPKQWNWAEEVVKASLDPQNQWEFPGNAGGYATPSGRSVGAPQQASWEQPRQRGSEVASRARERAEEVQRLERSRQEHHRHPLEG